MNYRLVSDAYPLALPLYKNTQKGYLTKLKNFRASRNKNIRLTL